jgi:hypothetical protein
MTSPFFSKLIDNHPLHYLNYFTNLVSGILYGLLSVWIEKNLSLTFLLK